MGDALIRVEGRRDVRTDGRTFLYQFTREERLYGDLMSQETIKRI